ncbi:MAG: DoxX family protein [Chloroflexota bacterium]|nr:DoxX family protein [Chloroflexota bacterium]
MHIALWVVQVVLAGMFLMAGVTKAFQYERARASLPWVKDVPRGMVTFIGLSELLGGLGLLLPALTGILPWLTPLAAAGLALVMLLAIGFHASRREAPAIAFNSVLLVLAAFVAYGRFFVLPLS